MKKGKAQTDTPMVLLEPNRYLPFLVTESSNRHYRRAAEAMKRKVRKGFINNPFMVESNQ